MASLACRFKLCRLTPARCVSLWRRSMKASDLIPDKPVWEFPKESDLPPPTKVSIELARYLERISLVHFEDEEAIKRLEAGIRFADQISLVDTDGVEPLIHIHESLELPMRDDIVEETDPNIVSLAAKSFEGYYVAPAGNIPYDGSDTTNPKQHDAKGDDSEK